ETSIASTSCKSTSTTWAAAGTTPSHSETIRKTHTPSLLRIAISCPVAAILAWIAKLPRSYARRYANRAPAEGGDHMAAISGSAQRVEAALAARGMAGRVRVLADSTRSAAEAAAAIGCDIAQIVKSLVFRGEPS